MKSYEVCISSLRKTQSYRRTNSLKAISPANFSKETRLQVPQMVLQQIISLNSLDVELYKYAQSIFAKQHKHFMRKLDTTDMQESIFDIAYDNPLWKVVSLAISLVCLLLLIFLIVNAKRRTSKLKIWNTIPLYVCGIWTEKVAGKKQWKVRIIFVLIHGQSVAHYSYI